MSEAPPRRLHMIGNAHLDVVWLWQCWDGLQEAWTTFRSALDRMREYPEFRFAASSAAYYAWVERVDSAMFEEIRERVAEGRWELLGGWWVEPDCNLPGGESLARQALHGQRWFRSRFGRTASVGFNVDSFGHAATLPMLLSQAGLTRYVFLRPEPHEQGLPRLFRWEAPDGSAVLALRVPYGYATGPEDVRRHAERCLAELKAPDREMACLYGVGNHGGGPTRANIESIRGLGDDLPGVDVRFSSFDGFFAAAESAAARRSLPVVRDELQHHASGCYAAHSGVKRWNRRAEQLLLAAEKAGVLAVRLGALPAADDLGEAWRAVLFNQFHDTLAGTSIEPAYEDARDGYGLAAAAAGRALHASLQAVAARVAVPHVPDTAPVVLFNPHGWPLRTVVELEAGTLFEADAIADEDGVEAPLQDVRSLATVGAGRRRVAFQADVPPLGYRVYRAVRGSGVASARPVDASGAMPATVLEDRRWRLEVDAASGAVVSLGDKVEGCEVLSAPAWAVVVADPGDTWAHGRLRFLDEVGSFGDATVRMVERGPVLSVLRVESRFGASRLVQDFTLLHGMDVVLVRVAVDWRERLRALKLRWPVDLHSYRATHEVPHGHVVRPAGGEEEPVQGWLDLSGVHALTRRRYGLSLLNDGKPSCDVDGSVMSLTVLRSPVFAHHDPRPLDPGELDDLAFIDQGWQRFTYALLPHAGSWEEAGTARRAAELNQPAVAFWHTGHPGRLPMAGSLLAVEPTSVAVVVCKRAEDPAGGTIVRLLETAGEAVSATLHLRGWGRDELPVELGPGQLLTLRVPDDPTAPLLVTDLLELDDRPL
ncbi:MAG TPA: glycoside hydrolase family 38 C-terminal domain-containing protein [Candidatus Dormibacteraeota bacterium]|nr:glycoside hydrolase family 38 C-terminal domain-containing protein [Candidatus Dormibacteraeota bacterium]